MSQGSIRKTPFVFQIQLLNYLMILDKYYEEENYTNYKQCWEKKCNKICINSSWHIVYCNSTHFTTISAIWLFDSRVILHFSPSITLFFFISLQFSAKIIEFFNNKSLYLYFCLVRTQRKKQANFFFYFDGVIAINLPLIT